jgi:hypothetical protein
MSIDINKDFALFCDTRNKKVACHRMYVKDGVIDDDLNFPDEGDPGVDAVFIEGQHVSMPASPRSFTFLPSKPMTCESAPSSFFSEEPEAKRDFNVVCKYDE